MEFISSYDPLDVVRLFFDVSCQEDARYSRRAVIGMLRDTGCDWPRYPPYEAFFRQAHVCFWDKANIDLTPRNSVIVPNPIYGRRLMWINRNERDEATLHNSSRLIAALLFPNGTTQVL